MKKNITLKVNGKKIVITPNYYHSIVLGSGAAGLNAAIRLDSEGVKNICLITEGLDKGTSINTGSDKQTYYKMGIFGSEKDSPMALAESFFNGGSMHGDIAMVEASLSARAFLNLVNLGVPFPTDKYGQYVGYKTDHDPLQRATSVGPYTSREMCRALIKELKKRPVEIREKRVAISLLTIKEKKVKRACGLITIDNSNNKPIEDSIEIYFCENLIFAVGGPGGLYKTSVYPSVHTGAIGLALIEGAKARNLPESQYGLASTKFRWNVSGTYMQVIPKFISTASDGKSDEREFMRDYFSTTGEMNSMIFLKGYQWPFDPRKVIGGSSIVDILVYIETVIRGRRVFLDFRSNCKDFSFDSLSEEAKTYLKKSNALFGTPIERLAKMNQPAIDLYLDHGIDIRREPLEIAVCAQHNNGGLAGNIWWESENIKHLFPIGEVNGSHGVYRPGGSALNSGQVGAFRAAEYIAHKYKRESLKIENAIKEAEKKLIEVFYNIEKNIKAKKNWQKVRMEIQERMSENAAHIRKLNNLESAVKDAWKLWDDLQKEGSSAKGKKALTEALRNIQLCFAHCVYLEAILFAVKSGVGSRGSALVLDKNGIKANSALDDEWRFSQEDESFKEKVLETIPEGKNKIVSKWVERHPLPSSDAWFENAWTAYREGKIYN
ncbi:MAG TPA: FAD-binding protein [Victivallales bacterium]|nr:FAD-binding protein [Victivallales bacterium]